MDTMYKQDGKLVIQNENDKIAIESWGRNSIRVRSVLMGELIDTTLRFL